MENCPKPWKGKQTLAVICQSGKFPVLVIHYSNRRKQARVTGKELDGSYSGYYLGTPTHVEHWNGEALEWILLARLHRE